MLCPRQKHATKSLLVAKLLYRRTSSGDRKFKKSGGAKGLMQDFSISSISLGGGVGAGQSRAVRTLSFRKFPFFWDLYGKSCNNGQGGRARFFFRRISRFVQMRTCKQEKLAVDRPGGHDC